jgi:hypothetical protein
MNYMAFSFFLVIVTAECANGVVLAAVIYE